MYGVKQPQYESEQSLTGFQQQVGFDNIPFVGAKSSLWRSGKLFHCPDVFVFDNQGRYIPYKDSLRPNCNGPAELFLEELKPGKDYNYSDLYTLSSFNNLVEDPQCNPVPEFKTDKIDYYVFITYAVFTGKKLIREKSLPWVEALKKNKNINSKLIYINLDLKECWSEEEKKFFESGN